MTDSAALIRQASAHAIPDAVVVEDAGGGHVRLRLEGAHGLAEIMLHGAHVWRWRPHGADEVLWRSPRTQWTPGLPLRGGIPLCWPWVGLAADKPLHGPVRSVPWRVERTAVAADGAVEALLALDQDGVPPGLCPARFRLELAVRAGTTLESTLTVRNTGDQAFSHIGGMHTYLAADDSHQARIVGFAGLDYHLSGQPDTWYRDDAEAIAVDGSELLRNYRDRPGSAAPAWLEDPRARRRIGVVRTGSASSIVWNPGATRSQAVADLGPDAWLGFCCIEATNLAFDARTVAPGACHRLGTVLSVAAG